MRRGLDSSADRLKNELRDATQQGEKDGYGGDLVEDAAHAGMVHAAQGAERLLRQKKNSRNTAQNIPEQFVESDHTVSDAIKTKDSFIVQQNSTSAAPQGDAQVQGKRRFVREQQKRVTARQQSKQLAQQQKEPVETATRQAMADDISAKSVVVSDSKTEIKQPSHAAKTAEKSAKRTVKHANRTMKLSDASVRVPPAASKPIHPMGHPAKHAEQLARVRMAAQTLQNRTRSVRYSGRIASRAGHAIAAAVRQTVSWIVAGGWLAVLLVLVVCVFGAAAGIYGGGAASHAELPISAEVYAYQPIIAEYAAKYGISEYIRLIEAVMMQESSGQGLDPMQASECGYNTKYPNTPGGITDPVYSIDCGVHELADCLKAANVQNPADLEHIKLALQGYNYGAGYISWALRKYGGYSQENALEFSEMKKAQLGTSVYGDPEYVPHVLRYYAYGYLFGGSLLGNQAILSVAAGEIGYREGAGGYTKYGAWYGLPNDQWCAMFVSWCAEQCGYIRAGICPKLAYTPDIVHWFQSRGQWYSRTITPPAGAYILFDWDGDGGANHVGLVEYVEAGRVHTIEGNSSNMVRRNSYPIGDANILGYGVPKYP